MYGITRRYFLRSIGAAGLILLTDDLPRYSWSAAIGHEQPYAFEANIKFFHWIMVFNFKVDAVLETRVTDDTYFSSFSVFAKGSKNTVDDLVYGHRSEGMVKNGILLPDNVEVRRNFGNLDLVKYLILLLSGNYRKDEFNLEFKYIGSGVEVNGVPYDSPRTDVLTSIVQALTDIKKGKKMEEAKEVKLVDKTGNPLTGEIILRDNIAAITIKEDSDFKSMAVVLGKDIEPQKIDMKGLYKRADVEAFRSVKID